MSEYDEKELAKSNLLEALKEYLKTAEAADLDDDEIADELEDLLTDAGKGNFTVLDR